MPSFSKGMVDEVAKAIVIRNGPNELTTPEDRISINRYGFD